MPVEIGRMPDKTLRVRFVRNASYGGVDYGPSFPLQIADLREDWANHFVRRGVAQFVPAGIPVQPEPEVVLSPPPAELASAPAPELNTAPEDAPAPKRSRRTRKADG